MLRHGLATRLSPADAERFVVTSAGTRGYESGGMHPLSEQVLGELSIDAAEFAPRALLSEMVAASDLVLTATRAHRAEAVTLWPLASRWTFTVREFGRLLEPVSLDEAVSDPVARASQLVAAAVGNRGVVRPHTPDYDDLPDPIGRPIDAYRQTATWATAAL